MPAKKLPELTPPYEISEAGKTFVPEISELARLENTLRRSVAYGVARETRTELEYQAALVEDIAAAERRLISLRFLQQLEREKAADRSWLAKVLGF